MAMVALETKDGHKYYDHNMTEVKPSGASVMNEPKRVLFPPTEGSNDILNQKEKDIKRTDGAMSVGKDNGMKFFLNKVMQYMKGQNALTEEETAKFSQEIELDRSDDVVKMSAMENEIKTLRSQVENDKKTAIFASDLMRIDSMVKSFRMTPAEAEEWKKIAQESPSSFAAALPALEKRTPFPQITGTISDKQVLQQLGANPESVLIDMAKKRADEKKCSFATALSEIARENPDIARLHMTMSGRE